MTTALTPYPHQIVGARFLAGHRVALLADHPRVGKTGTAIMAADYVMAETILVITTASGRGVWLQGFQDWSVLGRSIGVVHPGAAADAVKADVVIIGWPTLQARTVVAALLQRRWDLLISDEDHFAKSFDAKRTQAVYGTPIDGGAGLFTETALFSRADRVWPLTGTPLPHSPADMYPRLRALEPSRLAADPAKGWPDVTRYQDFLHRYCIVKMKKLSNWNRIPVVIGGRNEDELRERIKGFMLLRTQKDVGIRPPTYGLLPLVVKASQVQQANAGLDEKAVLAAIEKGETKALEMHLGSLRRVTGQIKAPLVIDAVKEEFDCGLDKIVLAYWHKDVGAALAEGLAEFGVTGVDGATPAARRDENVKAFSKPKGPRVFLAQIEAAGEAIDLSAAAVLWFVETTFSPRSMSQMSKRITNHTQKRQCVVKVCTLAGSIDEALQASLMRLWAVIRQVTR
jgi:hypothetical protein